METINVIIHGEERHVIPIVYNLTHCRKYLPDEGFSPDTIESNYLPLRFETLENETTYQPSFTNNFEDGTQLPVFDGTPLKNTGEYFVAGSYDVRIQVYSIVDGASKVVEELYDYANGVVTTNKEFPSNYLSILHEDDENINGLRGGVTFSTPVENITRVEVEVVFYPFNTPVYFRLSDNDKNELSSITLDSFYFPTLDSPYSITINDNYAIDISNAVIEDYVYDTESESEKVYISNSSIVDTDNPATIMELYFALQNTYTHARQFFKSNVYMVMLVDSQSATLPSLVGIKIGNNVDNYWKNRVGKSEGSRSKFEMRVYQTEYPLNLDLSNVTLEPASTSIHAGSTYTSTKLEAKQGYKLPDTITVENASSYDYKVNDNKTTGSLNIVAKKQY